LEALIQAEAGRLNLDVTCRQSNHEGQLIDWIHESLDDDTSGMVLNAGAFTHTSLAIADALEVAAYPIIEVHLSNIHAREPIRHHSMMAARVLGQICGLGPQGYVLALQALCERLPRPL
ncbi:MAG TPA: type II 3-dehydroquinate dehydratase, partial [Candidatus Obscuribacterales bacterium]